MKFTVSLIVFLFCSRALCVELYKLQRCAARRIHALGCDVLIWPVIPVPSGSQVGTGETLEAELCAVGASADGEDERLNASSPAGLLCIFDQMLSIRCMQPEMISAILRY